MKLMVNGYISLKEATKYCSYSADYLKLRARQGKLKSIKMGRNWFTTKEWVEEYLQKSLDAQNRQKLRIQVKSSEQFNPQTEIKKVNFIPSNLKMDSIISLEALSIKKELPKKSQNPTFKNNHLSQKIEQKTSASSALIVKQKTPIIKKEKRKTYSNSRFKKPVGYFLLALVSLFFFIILVASFNFKPAEKMLEKIIPTKIIEVVG